MIQKHILDRFWSKVDNYTVSPDICWMWKGTLRCGYGRFSLKGKKVSAHRFSWEIKFGIIPRGKIIMHMCDKPACVNPYHLKLGTQKQNMQDASVKKRLLNQIKRTCPFGHTYGGDNLIIITTKSGLGRQCAACAKMAASKSYKKHKNKRRLANKAWNDKNKEYRKEYKKNYRAKLKEKNNEKS